jgi:hypothetical protein
MAYYRKGWVKKGREGGKKILISSRGAQGRQFGRGLHPNCQKG